MQNRSVALTLLLSILFHFGSTHLLHTDNTCPPRPINYITDSLPQQCHFTAGPPYALNLDSLDIANGIHDAELDDDSFIVSSIRPESPHHSILSFNEWRDAKLGVSVSTDSSHGDIDFPPTLNGSGGSSVEYEVETTSATAKSAPTIDIDSTSHDQHAPSTTVSSGEIVTQNNEILYDDGKTRYLRSKDAGRTCKERFSYSSFDAGATVLKANPGAKNAKAILLENKDSYMLLECSTENKFVIVELSEDILIDTIVLANFEFFSSMIRRLRISVSDRYPVKLDKWIELGVFEALNSRDIQAFLVENPKIWAKYVRIEFLTHYGNEYYCPVSLLRVHGTTMIESWKEAEVGEIIEQANLEHDDNRSKVNETVSLDSQDSFQQASDWLDSDSELPPDSSFCGFYDFLDLHRGYCPAPTDPSICIPSLHNDATFSNERQDFADFLDQPDYRNVPLHRHGTAITDSELEPTQTGSGISGNERPPNYRTLTHSTASTNSHNCFTSSTSSVIASSGLPATTQAGSSAASPIIQDNVFKTVSKRLQLLESNISWAISYMEEQSRHFQASLAHFDDKRLAHGNAMLQSLNRSMTNDIRAIRHQYDLMWQSTVISLDQQRELSKQEFMALSSRLNALADEVVFQKRMAIGQSIVLLSCLLLIILSRSVLSSSPTPSSFWSDPFVLPAALNQHEPGSPNAETLHGRYNPRPMSPSAMYTSPPDEEKPDGAVGSSATPMRSTMARKPLPALPEDEEVCDNALCSNI